MTQYLENVNLQIPHDHICQRCLKIQSRSLKLYFRTGRSSPYNFPFVTLVLSKPNMLKRQVKSSKSLPAEFLLGYPACNSAEYESIQRHSSYILTIGSRILVMRISSLLTLSSILLDCLFLK